VLGCVVAYFIPISKKIWTPSYVLLTAGLAIAMLATCFWLIDIKDRRKWAWPFIVFGTNAILVYCLASVAARLLTRFKIGGPDGVTIKAWLMTHVFDATFSAPKAASLAFALSFVAVWLLLLIPLYRRRIFIKV
jgi:predicted acyltransferase